MYPFAVRQTDTLVTSLLVDMYEILSPIGAFNVPFLGPLQCMLSTTILAYLLLHHIFSYFNTLLL